MTPAARCDGPRGSSCGVTSHEEGERPPEWVSRGQWAEGPASCRRALGSRSAPNGPCARLASAVCPLPADVPGTLGIFPFEVKGRKGERQGKIRTLHYFSCCPPAPSLLSWAVGCPRGLLRADARSPVSAGEASGGSSLLPSVPLPTQGRSSRRGRGRASWPVFV